MHPKIELGTTARHYAPSPFSIIVSVQDRVFGPV